MANTTLGSETIQFFGIARQYNNLKDEILSAYDEVLQTGQVIGGEKTGKLEQEIASRCGRKYAVAVNSGTTALIFAMIAKNLASNSIVICPAESYQATVNSIISMGAKPDIIDTDYSGILDLKKLKRLSVKNASALMYANLYGNCIDYDKLTHMLRFFYDTQLPIIEDAAQSFGSTYKGKPSGSLGDIACLSFDPTKNLNNFGNGGMVVTDSINERDHMRQLRSNGSEGSIGWHNYGINVRMSEMDAACLLVKLKYFDEWQKRRTEIAEYYNTELSGLPNLDIPVLNPDVVSCWSKYVLTMKDSEVRANLEKVLDYAGIETRIHYTHTLYQHHNLPQPYYYKDTVAYGNSKRKISLPIYAELTDSEIERIVEVVKGA